MLPEGGGPKRGSPSGIVSNFVPDLIIKFHEYIFGARTRFRNKCAEFPARTVTLRFRARQRPDFDDSSSVAVLSRTNLYCSR